MFFSNLFSMKKNISDTNIIEEISSWVTAYNNDFFKEYDYLEEGKDETEIFEEARNLLFTFNEKALLKQMKKHKMNGDFITLNIIQNVAMMAVQNGSITELLSRKGKTQAGIDIYEFINKKKLEVHYISPKQYDDNCELIKNISHRLF